MPTKKRLKSLWAWSVVAAALFTPVREARAQERDPAAAQALFDQARQLVREGRYAEACPRLVESNRLDPGIGTQFHLADCYELEGKVASAWATFLDVASQARAAGQGDREKAAQKRAEKLLPRLPRLALNVPEQSRSPGLEIRRGGVTIGPAQWGIPMPVDPGEIEIVATASDKQPFKQTLRLEEGKTASFDLPALVAASPPPPAPAPPAAVVAGVDEESDAEEADAEEPSGSDAKNRKPKAEGAGSRALLYTLAAAGVVGLGVGTSFALMARSTNESSKAHCDVTDPNLCNATGVKMRNDALAEGNVATAGFIVGGAALAGAGLVLLFGGGSSENAKEKQGSLRPSAALGPRAGAVYVRGSF